MLMDDPISALDANVKKRIFKEVFQGLLRQKTRILVTHAVDFLHLADRIVIMQDGRITAEGTIVDLEDNPHLKQVMETHRKNHPKEKNLEEELMMAQISENQLNKNKPEELLNSIKRGLSNQLLTVSNAQPGFNRAMSVPLRGRAVSNMESSSSVELVNIQCQIDTRI